MRDSVISLRLHGLKLAGTPAGSVLLLRTTPPCVVVSVSVGICQSSKTEGAAALPRTVDVDAHVRALDRAGLHDDIRRRAADHDPAVRPDLVAPKDDKPIHRALEAGVCRAASRLRPIDRRALLIRQASERPRLEGLAAARMVGGDCARVIRLWRYPRLRRDEVQIVLMTHPSS